MTRKQLHEQQRIKSRRGCIIYTVITAAIAYIAVGSSIIAIFMIIDNWELITSVFGG